MVKPPPPKARLIAGDRGGYPLLGQQETITLGLAALLK